MLGRTNGVVRDVPMFVVDNHSQDFELLIGRPFTESPNIYVVKTQEKQNFYDKDLFFQLLQVSEPVHKSSTITENDIDLAPGINKVLVRSELMNGTITSNLSEQERVGNTIIVPNKEIEFCNHIGVMTVLNNKVVQSLQ
jgi:hypothetical protein